MRDLPGASRAVAYLLLVAAPYVFFTGAVFVPGDRPIFPRVLITVICIGFAIGGVACYRIPERIWGWFWPCVPFTTIAFVTLLNIITNDATTGAQIFYLWPVIYAANFLTRRIIYLTLALICATDGFNLFRLLPSGMALSDWASITIAFAMVAVIVENLRDRNERLREVLENHAYTDSLTGVANRRSFDVALERTVGWANHTGNPVALLTFDIDHFKKINDTWGHEVGDQALQRVATVLRQVAGGDAADLVARLGGDEFVALLRGDAANAVRVADEIRAALATATDLPCGPPGLSIGIAVVPQHAVTESDLRASSDAALYEAKSGGRGRTGVAPVRQNLDQVPVQDQVNVR